MAEEIELLEVHDIPVEEGPRIDAGNAEDVVIDTSWLSSKVEKLVSTDRIEFSPSTTICRVPPNICKYEVAAYNPRFVSIGPFHRGRENLQAMEEHKWRYLQEVLAFGEGRNDLEKFLKKMMEIETQARNCYSENIQMSSNEFVEMMLLDGIFIIFLIPGLVTSNPSIPFIPQWMSRLIHHDMLLLENQLPFFVLECLWELIGQPRVGQPRDTLRNRALKPFESFFSYELELNSPEEHEIHHLLHLVHLSLKPDSPTSSEFSSLHLFKSPKPSDLIIPSATELQEAGVRFHQLKQARSFFEVRFERGLMEMPRLSIDDCTGILFRNFIAFEQCFPHLSDHFTSYCRLIDFLVNTPRDISILRAAGIINNVLVSNKEVPLLINDLSKEIVWGFGQSYLADLMERVNDHTQKGWSKCRAKLVRDYFSNPWSIISLIAATMIFIFTFVQTCFSLFAYFKPPKP